MDELFLRMLNVSITAGWIVLAVVVLRLLLKRAPKAYHCALWAVVGLRLIWPFSIESTLSLIPSTQTIAPEQLYSPVPQIQSGIPAVDQVINPVFSQTFAPNIADSVNPLQVVMHIAGYVWLLGVACMLLYSLVSYWRLRRQVCAAVRQGGNVYLCDAVASPFILGIIDPRIYLPSSMDPSQMKCVLAHERAHLKRKDHWWKPLGFVLLAVYWFHPLIWVAYFLLCRDIEFACDEKVIKDMDQGQKAEYSETLLECSVHHKRIAACPLAFSETGVKGRIRSVLNYKKPALWVVILTVILCVALAACSLTEPGDTTVSRTDVAGNTYVYAKGGFGGKFTISIHEDGTFEYYEGLLSSHIGFGKWELKDGKLYLYDEGLSHIRTYVFAVKNHVLYFLALESDRFTYMDVADGDPFVMSVPGNDVLEFSPIFCDIDHDGVEEKFFYGTSGSGIVSFWISIYKPGEDVPEYSAAFPCKAARVRLSKSDNDKVIVEVRNSNRRLEDVFELIIKGEEIVLTANGNELKSGDSIVDFD